MIWEATLKPLTVSPTAGELTYPVQSNGEANTNSILTTPEVIAARVMARKGFPQARIAKLLGVSTATVCMIVNGERRSEETEQRVSACVNACAGFSTETLELIASVGGMQHKMTATAVVASQRDELLADAARYRWLRDSENQLTEDDPCVSDSFFSSWFGEKLDKVIDEMIERNASVKSYGKPEKSAKTEVQSIVFFPAGSLGEEIEEEGRPA
jgi:predicted transcriptional regulator